MTGGAVEQLQAYIPPLLRSLDGLAFIARHLDPLGYAHQLARIGSPHEDLRAAVAGEPWEPPYSALRPLLNEAASYAIAAFEALHEAADPPEDITRAYRALRNLPRALEALYPVAGIIPPVSRFFLDPPAREDAELQQRLFRQPPPQDSGVLCLGDDPDARETVWVYVPESCDPATPAPVVFALHGGAGRGRSFLWAWVRAARTRGAILVAPTSLAQTWSIQGEDRDSPHLNDVLSYVRQKWSVDPDRILLTGMSDGGTFTYTSGLLSGSPFTHLAPVAAAFHPMLAAMADDARVSSLPIHILHGTRDWMFPFSMAEDAEKHLSAMGANVTYKRLDDLSHAYGPDLSTMILDWFLA